MLGYDLISPFEVSSSTHNYLCLLFMIGTVSVLVKECFSMIRASYSYQIIIKDMKKTKTVINNIPEPIVVYLRDMGPVIKRTWNLFGEHFQELIGKCQYQEMTRLDEVDLNAHLKLPKGLENTEPYYRGGKLFIDIDVKASELVNWELTTIYGMKRTEVQDVLSGSRIDIVGVLCKPESFEAYVNITGSGSGPITIEIVSDKIISLRDSYPILFRLRSILSDWVHIFVLDATGGSGESFDPRKANRLYQSQELFVKSNATFEDGQSGENKSVEVSSKIMDRYGLEDRDPCLVCLESERDTILLPCRHSPVCEGCLLEIRKPQCPVCRANLDGYIIHVDNPEESL